MIGSPSGFVDLWAAKDGFQDGGLDQRSAIGPSARLNLQRGQSVKDVLLKVWPNGILTGTVLDDVGEPVAGVEILTLEESSDFDRTGWVVARSPRTKSDDRGRFRFAGVKPGRYLIAVPSSDVSYESSDVPAATGEFLTTYFPGVSGVTAASPVAVAAGETVEIGNLRLLPTPTNAVAVRGSLRGEIQAQWSAELIPVSPMAWSELDVFRTEVRDGSFIFPAVPSGTYRLRAMGLQGWTNTFTAGGSKVRIPVPPTYNRQSVSAASHVFWAEREIVVDSRALNVTLESIPGLHIQGRVVFDGDRSPPAAERVLVAPLLVVPTDGRVFRTMPTSNLDATGSFRTPAHPPGGYIVTLNPIDGWRAESLTAGGMLSADGRVELGTTDLDRVTVRMTDRLAVLEGLLTDFIERRPALSVLVFPADRRLWTSYALASGRLQAAAPNADGRFRFIGLLPGEYLVSVVTGDPPRSWRTASFLSSRIGGATSVTLRAGAPMVVNLSAGR